MFSFSFCMKFYVIYRLIYFCYKSFLFLLFIYEFNSINNLFFTGIFG
uniref:Uncharacterized protein n=1 Tax=Podoviridae sp. ctZ5d16 TaxID=2825257 RepID=A0A8S5Q866_9CAUD|nr:MAG TPA: hypothetical protein [Podoviridae sp. ctZ5d16]